MAGAARPRCTRCGTLRRLAAARRAPVDAAVVGHAHRFFEPGTPVFCSDIADLHHLLTAVAAGQAGHPAGRTPPESGWLAAACCPGTFPADDLAPHVAAADHTVAANPATSRAAGLTAGLLEPFGGSPHALRLLASLLRAEPTAVSGPAALDCWVQAARTSREQDHRRIVAAHTQHTGRLQAGFAAAGGRP